MLPHRLLIMALIGFGQSYPAIEMTITDCVEIFANFNNYAEDSSTLLSSTIKDAPEESTVNPIPTSSSAPLETSASAHMESDSTATLKPRTLPSTDIERASSTEATLSTTRTTTGAVHGPPLSSSEFENIEKTTVGHHSSRTSPLQQHASTSSEPRALPTFNVPTTKNSDVSNPVSTDTTGTSATTGATSATSSSYQSPSPTAEALVPTTSSSTSESPSKTDENQEEQTIEAKSTTPAPSSSTNRTDSIKEEINPKSLSAFLKGRRSRFPQRISTVQKMKNAWEKNWKSRTSRRPQTTTQAPPTTTAPPPLEEWDEERERFVEKRKDAEDWCITWTYDEGLSICNDFWRDLANFTAIAIITVVTAYFMN